MTQLICHREKLIVLRLTTYFCIVLEKDEKNSKEVTYAHYCVNIVILTILHVVVEHFANFF